MTPDEMFDWAAAHPEKLNEDERAWLKEALSTLTDDEVSALHLRVLAYCTQRNAECPRLQDERSANGYLLRDALNILRGFEPDADADILRVAKEVRVHLLRQDEIDAQFLYFGTRTLAAFAATENAKRVSQLRRFVESEQVEASRKTAKAKRDAARLKAKAAEEERKAAEYAALLAEGRKSRTLQQAYANGDFIPLDTSNEPSIPSSTGRRLGARG